MMATFKCHRCRGVCPELMNHKCPSSGYRGIFTSSIDRLSLLSSQVPNLSAYTDTGFFQRKPQFNLEVDKDRSTTSSVPSSPNSIISSHSHSHNESCLSPISGQNDQDIIIDDVSSKGSIEADVSYNDDIDLENNHGSASDVALLASFTQTDPAIQPDAAKKKKRGGKKHKKKNGVIPTSTTVTIATTSSDKKRKKARSSKYKPKKFENVVLPLPDHLISRLRHAGIRSTTSVKARMMPTAFASMASSRQGTGGLKSSTSTTSTPSKHRVTNPSSYLFYKPGGAFGYDPTDKKNEKIYKVKYEVRGAKYLTRRIVPRF